MVLLVPAAYVIFPLETVLMIHISPGNGAYDAYSICNISPGNGANNT